MEYLIIIVVAAITVLIVGAFMRCPSCGRMFAQRHRYNESHGYTDGTKTIKEKLPVKNKSGSSTGDYVEQERLVSVRWHTYTPHFECRWCKNQWRKDRVTKEG
jgi:hypothetical protein